VQEREGNLISREIGKCGETIKNRDYESDGAGKERKCSKEL